MVFYPLGFISMEMRVVSQGYIIRDDLATDFSILIVV